MEADRSMAMADGGAGHGGGVGSGAFDLLLGGAEDFDDLDGSAEIGGGGGSHNTDTRDTRTHTACTYTPRSTSIHRSQPLPLRTHSWAPSKSRHPQKVHNR